MPNLNPHLRTQRKSILPAEPLVQIRRTRTEAASSAKLEKARGLFLRRRSLLLPGFLSPSLLKEINRNLHPEDFFQRRDKKIAQESCMRKNALFDRLHFYLNDEKLFECIRTITHCPRIRAFQGRLYQFIPGMEHYDSWHDDLGAGRLVGLSLQLGTSAYKEGFLELRRNSDRKTVSRIKHQKPGDALIFHISPGFKHRVSPVAGSHPRIAFAGWFLSHPKFTALIR